MAAKPFYSGIDLKQTSVVNAVIHPLAGAPSAPKPGQFYYNTASNVAFVWNGTTWRPFDAGALTDASIPIAALVTNPLARANHTGTQAVSTLSDFDTAVRAYRLDQFAAPTAAVSMNGQSILLLADPTTPQGAATKNYVDTAVQSAAAGIDSKPSVRVVAVANITLSGTQTIDGVSLVAGDAVLAVAQTTASQNGVYVVASGAWTRRTTEDQTGEITPGAFWFVEEGTTYKASQWRCSNTGAVTIGTTSITIVQFGASSSYTAGNGIAIAGGVISVVAKASGGIVVDGTGVSLDTTIAARKFSATITGDGSATSFTVTHNLGTQDIVPAFRDSANVGIEVDWVATSTTVMTVNFAVAPTNGTTFRATVLG